MSAASKFMQKAAGNIAESLGGDGVHELLAATPVGAASAGGGSTAGRGRNREAGTLDIGMVVPDPEQPRKEFDEDALARLSESLKKRGQLQNLRVRWSAGLQKWVIISGERRYRAALRAGLKTLKCEFVEKELTDAERLEDALVENCLREDLNSVELAQSYQRLMVLRGYNAQELAAALDVSGGAVSKTLSLLRLPSDIQQKVVDGVLPRSTAYEISRLPSEGEQRAMVERAEAEGFSNAEVAGAVQSRKGRRNHAVAKSGKRFRCTLGGGSSVSVVVQGELTLDGLIGLLAEVSKAAKKAKSRGHGVEAVLKMLEGDASYRRVPEQKSASKN